MIAHKYKVVREEPTCTQTGTEKKVCEVCGKVTDEKTLAKVEHKWVDKQKQVSYLEQGYIKPGDEDVDIAKKFGYDIYTDSGTKHICRTYYNCLACRYNASENSLPYYDKDVRMPYNTAYYFYSHDFDTAEAEVQKCNGTNQHQYDYQTINKNTDLTGKFYGDMYGGGDEGKNAAGDANADHQDHCKNVIYYLEHGKNYGASSGEDHFYKFIEKEKTVTYQACSVCGAEK